MFVKTQDRESLVDISNCVVTVEHGSSRVIAYTVHTDGSDCFVLGEYASVEDAKIALETIEYALNRGSSITTMPQK